MKNKIFFALGFTFLVGVLVQYLKSPLYGRPVTSYDIGFLIGGGLATLFFTTIVPIIVSLIVYAIKKKFPANLFLMLTYAILILFTVMLIAQMLANYGKQN